MIWNVLVIFWITIHEHLLEASVLQIFSVPRDCAMGYWQTKDVRTSHVLIFDLLSNPYSIYLNFSRLINKSHRNIFRTISIGLYPLFCKISTHLEKSKGCRMKLDHQREPLACGTRLHFNKWFDFAFVSCALLRVHNETWKTLEGEGFSLWH